MTVYNLDVLLCQIGISPLFHVWYYCCILTYIQVAQETSKVVWYSHLFKKFLQFVVIHIVKVLILVSEAEVDNCLEFRDFLCDVMNASNLISGSSTFSKFSLYIWKFSVHIPLKPILKDTGHNLTSMWGEYDYPVVWTFFGTALLWDLNEKFELFQSCGHCCFPNLLTYWVQHHHLGFEIAQLEFHHLH